MSSSHTALLCSLLLECSRSRGASKALALSVGVALLQGCSVIFWALGDSGDAQRSSPPAQEASTPAASPPPSSDAATSPAVVQAAALPATERTPQSAVAPQVFAVVPGAPPAAPERPVGLQSPAAAREPEPVVARAAPVVTMPAPAPVRGKSNTNDSELAPGRYAAQVGAFRIEASAYSVRDQVSSQLATVGTFVANEGVTRVVRRGSLFHVLVGETDSAKAATALAARVREALKQDVIVFRP